MTQLNGELIDWQNIDEIIQAMGHFDGTAEHVRARRRRIRKKVGSSGDGGAEGGGGAKEGMATTSGGGGKRRIGGGSSNTASAYAHKPSPRTLKRREFNKQRASDAEGNRGKRMKRKKSAESIQKLMRANLAKRRVQRMRESKAKLKAGARMAGTAVRHGKGRQ